MRTIRKSEIRSVKIKVFFSLTYFSAETFEFSNISMNFSPSRDGEEVTLDAKQLCLGDIVLINAGDQIPADIRIFDARNFKGLSHEIDFKNMRLR
jgi:magnesium-transporting ATPase (P-type)